MLMLAADTTAAPDVRAMAELKITALRRVAAERARRRGPAVSQAHWMAMAGDLARWVDRREPLHVTQPLEAPPGDPFGDP